LSGTWKATAAATRSIRKIALAHEVVGRLMAGRTPGLGDRDGRRIDHDHAGEQQDQHAPQQGVVDLGQLAARRIEGADHHD
jgi:hypothetical protein